MFLCKPHSLQVARRIPQHVQHLAHQIIICTQRFDERIGDAENRRVVYRLDSAPRFQHLVRIELSIIRDEFAERGDILQGRCSTEVTLEDERVADNEHRHLLRLFTRFLHEDSRDFLTEPRTLLEGPINDGGSAPDTAFQNFGGFRYRGDRCRPDGNRSRDIGNAPLQPTVFGKTTRFINAQQNIAEFLFCRKARPNLVPRHRPE